MSDNKEQDIRDNLKAGGMVGKKFSIIYRPPGGTRAIIEIGGILFAVDDSTRPLHAGMVHDTKAKRYARFTITEHEFDNYPRLTNDDFMAYDRKHVPRNYKKTSFNTEL